MPHPKPETVAAHGMKVPEELTRPEFIDLKFTQLAGRLLQELGVAAL